jgi:hypothetical protein
MSKTEASNAQAHDGMAGVYDAVLIEGTLRKRDSAELLD